MNKSRYEKNIFAQPRLVAEVLAAKAPSWLESPPKGAAVSFVGVGSNHHAAQLASWLWRSIGHDANALHSYDFVQQPRRIARNDLGVFLSHRGGRSYTVRAESLARRAGVRTAIVTGAGSGWEHSRRLETGPLEDTGAYTQSLTCTMAWLARWAGDAALLAPFKNLVRDLAWGPAFPAVAPDADLVFVGDGPREWIAREAALKCQEAAYLRARAFGLEEFLHGPQISVGPRSIVVGFSSPMEKRWSALRAYLKTVGVPFHEAASRGWLAPLLWAQRFALECCRARGIDPDALRENDPRYLRAKTSLRLGLPPRLESSRRARIAPRTSGVV